MTAATEGVREHEVFSNAPLQLVAVEVTYLPTDTNFNPGLFGAIETVIGAGAEVQIAGQIRLSGPAGADGASPAESILFRMTNADRTVAVSAWPTSLIVECSDYERFTAFRELVRAAVNAYAGFMEPAGLSRFGMRYIDEVHVPAPIRSIADWQPYVNPLLLGPAALVDEPVTNLATGFTIDLGEHRLVNVRCATTPSRALAAEGHLRLRERPDTPALVLDIDAIFQPPRVQQTPISGDLVAGLADELRPAVRRIFDSAFTTAALDTFRNRETL